MSYDPLEPGDAATAASIDSRFATAVTRIDTLPLTAIRDRGVRRENADVSLKVADSQMSLSSTIVHSYANVWIADDSDTVVGTPGVGVGWSEITDGTLYLTRTWSNIALGMAQADRVAGVFVRANIHLLRISWGGSPDGGTKTRALTAAFALQVRGENGTTWKTLDRTARHVSAMHLNLWNGLAYADINICQYHDVPLATLITPADLTSLGFTGITGVRAVAAVCLNLTFGLTAASYYLDLGEGTITAVQLHAGDV